jgi:pilus assembly protein CpaB
MKMRNLALPAALLLAVLAAAAMLLYTTTVKHEAASGGDTLSVVVATQDVRAGTQLDALIDDGTLTVQQIPKSYVAPGAITSLDELSGKTNSQPIVQGEQVLSNRIAELGTTLGGGLGIPEGYTAISIQLPSPQGVGQAVHRGDHVQIFATFHGLGDGSQTKTVALIPDVEVLDAFSLGTEEAKSDNILFTFALKAEDAGKLTFGIDNASVWLSLLPPDAKGQTIPPVTLGNVTK